MANIPKHYIKNYAAALDKLSEEAKAKIRREIDSIDFSDVVRARERIVSAMDLLVAPLVDRSAETACDFYKLLRSDAGESTRFEPFVYETYDEEAAERSVRYFVGDIVTAQEQAEREAESAAKRAIINAGVAKLVGNLESRIDYEIKRAAGENILQNAKNDPAKPRFARVPAGNDTCEFCIMLASQGFVYHTAETAGKHKHYHPNCRCQIVPGFSRYDGVEGYDPDAYYEQFQANESARKEKGLETMSAKGNRLRRERKAEKR